MKKVVAAVMLLGVLTACGGDVLRLERECRDQGGEVVKIGTQVTCVVDGAVVAEWSDYSE